MLDSGRRVGSAFALGLFACGVALAGCGSSDAGDAATTAQGHGGNGTSGSTSTSAAGGASTGSGGATTGAGGASTSAGGSGVAGGGGGSVGGAGGQGGAPAVTPCTGHPLAVVCAGDSALTCDANGDVTNQQACAPGVCEDGVGCVACLKGQFSCNGNELLGCDTNAAPPEWAKVDDCNPKTEVCDTKVGACVKLAVTGGTTPTGLYFRYARFTKGKPVQNVPGKVFWGGCDVGSYKDLLYVNRDSSHLDVYKVDLLDSDKDGKLEPNQHPDNPDEPGPVEERTITWQTTYDIPELGTVAASELFPGPDKVTWVVGYPSAKAELWEYVFATGVVSKIANAPSPIGVGMAFLGRDQTTGVWYSGVHYERTVYSYHEPSKSWVPEFKYPNLAGNHMDGMEIVTDPNTGITYAYVSDMTSDFLGQYVKVDGEWTQQNLFKYHDVSTDNVEGMGFGALDHFWASGCPEGSLYEIGGGDLTKFTHH
jgi:hypothetical protein